MPIESLDTMTSARADEEHLVLDLLERGVITEAQLASARAAQAGLPFVELLDFPIDHSAVSKVPAAMCRRYEVLPIGYSGGYLILAMVDPGNVFAIDDVRAATGQQVKCVVAERSDLRAAIDRYHRADGELSSLRTELEEVASADLVRQDQNEPKEDDAPIVRFVNLLISQGIQDMASDIHIEPGEYDMGVRYRIDGVMHEMQRAPKNIQNGVISRLKIMADIDIAERRRPQDGRMSVSHGGRKIDLRVATLPTVWGEKVVMRILDNSSSGMSMDDLNLLPRNLEVYKKSYSKPYCMILITGPTGSGKSTTLYTPLTAVARPEINVITVEDPVEYRMKGINQVQVNPKAWLTFASALRSILRSDPDVVLLGEIRDHETAQIAIEASLTGHLVLSTLHTRDAPNAVSRLLDMGVEPFLLASAIDNVVAQRLARKLCEHCKTAVLVPAQQMIDNGFHIDEDLPVCKPVGCDRCNNTGYKGRLGVFEVLLMTEHIRELVLTRSSADEIARVAVADGMLRLREDGLEKIRLGLTSPEEILRVTASGG